MKIIDNLYTTLLPEEVWKVYADVEGLFRSGGNRKDSKLIGPKGIRARDFLVAFDDEDCMDVVMPHNGKGLSFSDNIPRLQRLGISGVVWCLPKDAVIPRGLVVNYKNKDHPMINVETKMTLIELEAKLKVLAQQMIPTEVRIK